MTTPRLSETERRAMLKPGAKFKLPPWSAFPGDVVELVCHDGLRWQCRYVGGELAGRDCWIKAADFAQMESADPIIPESRALQVGDNVTWASDYGRGRIVSIDASAKSADVYVEGSGVWAFALESLARLDDAESVQPGKCAIVGRIGQKCAGGVGHRGLCSDGRTSWKAEPIDAGGMRTPDNSPQPMAEKPDWNEEWPTKPRVIAGFGVEVDWPQHATARGFVTAEEYRLHGEGRPANDGDAKGDVPIDRRIRIVQDAWRTKR